MNDRDVFAMAKHELGKLNTVKEKVNRAFAYRTDFIYKTEIDNIVAQCSTQI